MSVFSDTIPETTDFQSINPQLEFFVAYTNIALRDLSHSAGLSKYAKILNDLQYLPLTIAGETVVRVCNFATNSTMAMHRTMNLD